MAQVVLGKDSHAHKWSWFSYTTSSMLRVEGFGESGPFLVKVILELVISSVPKAGGLIELVEGVIISQDSVENKTLS